MTDHKYEPTARHVGERYLASQVRSAQRRQREKERIKQLQEEINRDYPVDSEMRKKFRPIK